MQTQTKVAGAPTTTRHLDIATAQNKNRITKQQHWLICSHKVLTQADGRRGICGVSRSVSHTTVRETSSKQANGAKASFHPVLKSIRPEHESWCATLLLCLLSVQCLLSQIGWCWEGCQQHTNHDWANIAPQAVLCSWLQTRLRAISGSQSLHFATPSTMWHTHFLVI